MSTTLPPDPAAQPAQSTAPDAGAGAADPPHDATAPISVVVSEVTDDRPFGAPVSDVAAGHTALGAPGLSLMPASAPSAPSATNGASAVAEPKVKAPPPPDDGRDLSPDEIERVGGVKRKRVYSYELQRWTNIQQISAVAREAIEASAIRVHDDGEREINVTKTKLDTVMAGWVNANGERIYVGAEGRKRLERVRHEVTDEVFMAIMTFSGMDTDAPERIAGNSTGGLSLTV